MRELFETNKDTYLSFKPLLDKIIDGKRIQSHNVLVGYKFKNDDEQVI